MCKILFILCALNLNPFSAGQKRGAYAKIIGRILRFYQDNGIEYEGKLNQKIIYFNSLIMKLDYL